ncbi:hypothetical protein BJ508DRAFT_301571 [Ascobolus immersus RN42]|uniref:Uncharacterized protein n=1 Tax=Ascobolus immersus RN42 TaxID=1160509 RepID=A0A3N4IKT7_ASCIM|nr:hypothetical protein BJ508DRAFT_301571 [Ascobolus immersus RN42]
MAPPAPLPPSSASLFGKPFQIYCNKLSKEGPKPLHWEWRHVKYLPMINAIVAKAIEEGVIVGGISRHPLYRVDFQNAAVIHSTTAAFNPDASGERMDTDEDWPHGTFQLKFSGKERGQKVIINAHVYYMLEYNDVAGQYPTDFSRTDWVRIGVTQKSPQLDAEGKERLQVQFAQQKSELDVIYGAAGFYLDENQKCRRA